MPNYNNFQSGYGYPMYSANSYQTYQQPQMQYAQANGMSYQNQQTPVGIVWVDGEVGAKAYQLPANWPVNAPMPLWDTNDTIIYLKSTNQMGMPNPLQKVHYTMDEVQRSPMMGQSGQTQPALTAGEHSAPDMSNYVTKSDLEQMKEELKTAMTTAAEQKGARSNGKSAV